MQHRVRDLLMRQRTQLINAMRAHMAELGIVAAQGREGIKELLKIVASEEDVRLPVNAHASLVVLAAGIQAVQTMIGSIEKRIIVQHRSNETSKRLETIAGIGVIGATAIATTVGIRRPSDRVVIWRPGSDLCAQRFDRWQTEARADFETGRPISETHSGGRSPRGVEARASATEEYLRLFSFSPANRSR